jgi:hypothetical protein
MNSENSLFRAKPFESIENKSKGLIKVKPSRMPADVQLRQVQGCVVDDRRGAYRTRLCFQIRLQVAAIPVFYQGMAFEKKLEMLVQSMCNAHQSAKM